jgi:DNA-binding Xre family transcriptional regulator
MSADTTQQADQLTTSSVKRPLQHRSEAELRAAVVKVLRDQGLGVGEQVVCDAGVADIVTIARDTIFEIKHRLTRAVLYQALGQILIYRHCINPDARAIIVGYPTTETATLLPHLAALGVEVVCWRDRPSAQEQVLRAEKTPPQQPRAPLTPHSALRWIVAQLARDTGISNVPKLAFKLQMSRQSLYPIFESTAKSASLSTIGKLCRSFQIAPGDWFVWAGVPDGGSMLHWNIAYEAGRRGLDQARLGYRAEVHHKTIGQIWHGTMSVAYLETLARLARVLDLPEHPFSTGGLLGWGET